MKKPLLLHSLPNSGSTWLAEVIANTLGLRFCLEYFNPIRNPNRELRLARNFGSELVSCYRNIVSVGDASIHEDIAAMWGADGYEFTKEVFSPFKLPVFVKHFRCVVLLRDSHGVFPPSRARIWSFYEHAWHALREAGCKVRAEGIRARAYEAHAIMSAFMRESARQLEVPIIEYETLFGSRAEVARVMAGALGDDGARCVAAVLATRRAKNEWGDQRVKEQLDGMLQLIEEILGKEAVAQVRKALPMHGNESAPSYGTRPYSEGTPFEAEPT